jgi:hypothetical protein
MRHQKRFHGGRLLLILTGMIAVGCSVDPTPPNDPRSSSSAVETANRGGNDDGSERVAPQECGGLGAPCEMMGDCCDLDCSPQGICGHPAGTDCKGRGAHCRMNGDCCSMDCHFSSITSAVGSCR